MPGTELCTATSSSPISRLAGCGRALRSSGPSSTAAAATVLGDFNGGQLEHFEVTTTFFRDGDKFMVRTDGPDGALHEYPIAYTFGVYPLQQYLIAMPGVFADQSQSIPDNLVPLLGQSSAWNCSDPERSDLQYEWAR